MIFQRRKQRPLLPFTVMAKCHDEPSIRIGVLAHSITDAMATARELFPDHLVTTAALEAEWEEDPA